MVERSRIPTAVKEKAAAKKPRAPRIPRSSDVHDFQQTTHPEWIIQVTVPDGYMGDRGPITAELIHEALLGVAAGLGMKEEDRETRVRKVRNLNVDKEKLTDAIKAGANVPGIKTKFPRSVDAKPIPVPRPDSTS